MAADETIIAGQSVGKYILNMPYETILELLNEEKYVVRDLMEYTVVECSNIKFWISKKDKKAKQILVHGSFEGKFCDVIGIGSNLTQVKTFVGEWYQELDAYYVKNHIGICFQLYDEDDWNADTAPIEFISVFTPDL